jgi:hypothetical protein
MRSIIPALAAVLAATVAGSGTAVAQRADHNAYARSGAPSGEREHLVVGRDRLAGCHSGHSWDRHRRGGCGFGYAGYGYAEDSWALYNNRSWSEDSYNDWWHDRPDRAYPRWMSHNRDCARRWYMGDTLTC